MARKQLYLCIDRVIPMARKIQAAHAAVGENLNNAPRMPPKMAGASTHPVKMALLTGKKWKNGRTLGVKFLDGSATQKQRVTEHAKEWMKYANIKLNFAKAARPNIRISFRADSGSWSAVGTDCLVEPKNRPTMNFGWLEDDTDDEEYGRVVVHEFGHALGAIHEHQSPKGGIKWNVPAVYKYFSGPPNNWTKEDIDFNVLEKYSVGQLNATMFDIHSIMLYAFPPELIIGGKGTPNNVKLSTGDKRFIRKMYPAT